MFIYEIACQWAVLTNSICTPALDKKPLQYHPSAYVGKGKPGAYGVNWHRASGYCAMPLAPYLVIDVDDWRALPELLTLFPQFAQTTYVDTSKGMHFYFRLEADEQLWRSLPNVIKAGDAELFSLRGSFWNTYVIGPHSKRSDGFVYRTRSDPFPPAVVTGEQMRAFIDRYNPPISREAVERVANLATPRAERFSRALNIAKYVEGAISSECAALAATPEGARNITLYYAALRLFSFVRAGYADAFEVTQALTDAARISGLTDVEIASTIRSAAKVAKPSFAQHKIERAISQRGKRS